MSDAVSEPVEGHPLADGLASGAVLHHFDGAVAELTAPVADLLVTAVRSGRRVVLHTSAETRLSAALAAALRDTGGVWLAQLDSGAAWDGLTGRVIDDADSLLPTAAGGTRIAPAFAAGAEPEAMQVVLAASVRHRRDTEPRFGALLEAFAAALGAPPTVYGPHEPLERAWDRTELTALLSARPDAPRLLVAGTHDRPMTGSLLVRPTRIGFEETVEATVALERGTDDTDAFARRVRDAFERSAGDVFPLFGFVLVRPGRRDTTRRPVLEHAPAPVAVLIGAPGVRDLGVDVDALVRRFGAVRVGRPRVPALLVPFGARVQDWATVDRLVEVLGVERVTAAFGRPLPGTPLARR